MIYLDNAATTLHKPECVIAAVTAALGSMGNASRGAHEGSLAASRVVFEAREKVARLLGCGRADHVAFTCNATEALNIAIAGTINEGDHVITTDLEHNSVLRPLYRLEAERGVSLGFVRADECGRPVYDDFERLLEPNTRVVVCTHASNVTGDIVDLRRVSAFAHEHGLLLIVDASQSAGCVPLDMTALGIDVLCFTGHKGLYGPQGTGGVCVREGVDVRPWKVGGTGVSSFSHEQPAAYPTRLEAGTLNGHGIAGLSAALDFVAETGVETIAAHEAALASRFVDQVASVDGVTVYGDVLVPDHGRRTATVSINVRDYDSAAVSDALSQTYDIATRPGAHCAPRMHESMGTTDRGTVRFSFGWFNTAEDADEAAVAVREIAS